MVGCKGHHFLVLQPWEISQLFGFPVRMMGVGVLGTTSFQEILCSAFLEASQSYKVSEH